MEKTTVKWTFAEKNLRTKLALSNICIICSFCHLGFYPGCPVLNHVVYSFFHVNGFHLAVNLIVLWGIRNKIDVALPFLVAVIASFLPMYVSEPTMGLSGFLFAAFGSMWGKTGKLKDAFTAAMPFIFATMLLPNVSGLLHLYCFTLGYLFEFLFIKAKAAVRHG